MSSRTLKPTVCYQFALSTVGKLRLMCTLGMLTMIVLSGSAFAQSAFEIVPGPCVVPVPDEAEITSDVSCGTFYVPRDRSYPNDDLIGLPFVRASQKREAADPPMFMLSGGPGSSLLTEGIYAVFSDPMLGPLIATRDIFILEELDSKHSVPSLDCTPFHRLPWRAVVEDKTKSDTTNWLRDAIQTCKSDAEADGIDLTKFNSLQMAQDLDAACEAFGYEKIAVYGASYGTLLAQHYARMFGNNLEALILDGAETPTTQNWAENRAIAVDFSIGQLATQCSAEPKCAAEFDLLSLVQEGIDLFQEGPIPTTYVNPKDETETLTFSISKQSFVEFVFERQSGQISVGSLPAILTLLLADGRASLSEGLGPIIGQAALEARDTPAGNLASLMHFTVVCSEDPVNSTEDVKTTPDTSEYASLFSGLVGEQYNTACETLALPELSPDTDEPLRADVPTLILTGQLDARTPAFLADKVEESLPNAQQFVFPSGTHVQIGEFNRCAASLLVKFLADVSNVVSAPCLNELEPVNFVLPDGSLSRD